VALAFELLETIDCLAGGFELSSVAHELARGDLVVVTFDEGENVSGVSGANI
jgi:hypothetical protein